MRADARSQAACADSGVDRFNLNREVLHQSVDVTSLDDGLAVALRRRLRRLIGHHSLEALNEGLALRLRRRLRSLIGQQTQQCGRSARRKPAPPPRQVPSKLRRESTGLAWLAGTSIVSRCRQNTLSCGLRPALIAVAQGP